MIDTIHTQHNGRLFKMFVFAVVVAFFLSGCSAEFWSLEGFGDGDWALDLYEGYQIVRTDSHAIKLSYSEDSNDTSGGVVITHFFITAYQLHQPYICLEGIRTKSLFSVSEEELENRELSYYIVDSVTNEIYGPYESYDDFAKQCDSLTIALNDDWVQTEDIRYDDLPVVNAVPCQMEE